MWVTTNLWPAVGVGVTFGNLKIEPCRDGANFESSIVSWVLNLFLNTKQNYNLDIFLFLFFFVSSPWSLPFVIANTEGEKGISSHAVMSLDRGLTYWRNNSLQVLHETLPCEVTVQGLKARTFARGHHYVLFSAVGTDSCNVCDL